MRKILDIPIICGPLKCHSASTDIQCIARKVVLMNLLHLQGRRRDPDIENRHVDTEGKGGGMNREIRIDLNILPCITGCSARCSVMT